MYGRKTLSFLGLALLFFTVAVFISEDSDAEVIESGTCGEGLTWSFEDGVLTIEGQGDMDNYSYDEYSYEYDMTAPPWDGLSFTSVIISDGVTSIGSCAFYDSAIESISMPDSIRRIGSEAFYSCNSLSSISLPVDLEDIGYRAFYNNGFTSLIMPKNLLSISSGAFENCYSLNTVTTNYVLKSIYSDAFSGCSIKTVNNNSLLDIIAGSTTYGYIAYKAEVVNGSLAEKKINSLTYKYNTTSKVASVIGFDGTEADICIDAVEIDEVIYSVVSIEDSLFRDNTNIKSLEIKGSDVIIGSCCFYGCTSLASIKLGPGIKMGNSAFSYCTSLQSIQFSSNTKVIGNSAFSYCTSLQTVDLKTTGVESIGYNAFYKCTSLRTIDLNLNGLSSIGSSAFNGCSSLLFVELGSDVKSIGSSAFSNCSKLRKLDLNEGLKNIEYGAFSYCSSLLEVYIPSTVETLGYYEDYYGGSGIYETPGIFTGCSKLSKIDFSQECSVKIIPRFAFYNCSSLTSLTLPDSLEEIEDSAFYNCTNLSSIYFGDNLKVIGSGTYSGLDSTFGYTAIQEINLPDSVIEIGQWTFYECKQLRNVTLGSIEILPSRIFYNCYSLKSITIPDSVTSISSSAFDNCGIISITLGSGLTSISANIFSGLSIKTINIPSGVTSIGDGAFKNCYSLMNVILPETLTTLYDDAFSGCSKLESIILPNSLEWIGSNVFAGCTSLRMIEIPSSVEYYFADSLSGLTFFDTDGETILDSADVDLLKGHTYSGTYSKLVKDSFMALYYVDGVLQKSELVIVGNTYNLYTKVGHTIAWTSAPVVAIENNSFVMPESNIRFYGTSTPIKYTVSVNFNGGTLNNIPDGWVLSEGVYVKEYDYGTSVSVIKTLFADLQKTESQLSWLSSSNSVTTSGLELDAQWILNRYVVHWMNDDGSELHNSSVEYGSIPTYVWYVPTKDPTNKISYSFDGWSPALTPVTGEAYYYAQYTESVRQYSIKFIIDGSTVTKYVEYGTLPESPDNVVKSPTLTTQYKFEYWVPSIQNVTSDATYTAVFSPSPRIYVISWVNDDSTLIKADNVAYGSMPLYTGPVPMKSSSVEWSYTFKGWDKEITVVSGDVKYQAIYTQSPRTYTVTWMNDLGETLKIDEGVVYGSMPGFSESTPVKVSTAEYAYAFDTWYPLVKPVSEDITYTAVFSASKMRYSVTWKDYDGTMLAVNNEVEYGTIPSYSGATPNRSSTSQYLYSFTGWSPEVSSVTGNVTYTAQYSQTLQSYVVTWLNDDGTRLSIDNVPYGSIPVYSGTPTKDPSNQYEYTFSRWTPAVVAVSGDVTYTAAYDRSVRCYSVLWKNYDGTVLESYYDVPYGSIPTYNGDTPSKPGTESEKYTFFGWSPVVTAVTGDVEFTAMFSVSEAIYSVTWRNSNGSVLKIDNNVRYGTLPEYSGDQPTLSSDPQYTYSFLGWSPTVVTVTCDTEYVAQYSKTLRSYTVRWYDDLGNLLKTDEGMTYGSRPSYSGGEISKESTAEYTYTFAGWTPEISSVTEDASYKAVFKQDMKKYSITWRNSEGTVILVDPNVIYGSMPSYTGLTPVKPSTAEYQYVFSGWSPAIISVSGDAEYVATFTPEKMKYAVTWKNHDGTVLDIMNGVEYGTVPIYVGATPSRLTTAQYTYSFIGWSPSVTAVTGNVTYTAQYSESVNSYIITWKDSSGHVLDVQDLAYGSEPVFAGEVPTKDADVQYTYEFIGWSPELKNVSESVTYTPVFNNVLNTYSVTWCDESGDVIRTDEGLVYGTMPSFSGTIPTKESTEMYQFTFSGWYPTVTVVNGDVSYKALFSGEMREYTVTWKDESGSLLEIGSVKYGSVPVYTGIEPTKESSSQYDFYFTGWSPSLTAVYSDTTFTAVYGSQTRSYSVSWVNYDGTVIEYDMGVPYGTHPTYDGDVPVRPANGYFEYRFVRWMNYVDTSTVIGDVIYTAVFEEYQAIFEVFFTHYNGDTTLVTYRLASPVITEPDAYLGVPKGCTAYWSYYQLDGRPDNNVSVICNSYLDYSSTMSPNGGVPGATYGISDNVTVVGTNSFISLWYAHLGDERYIEIPDTTADGRAVTGVDSIIDTSATSIKFGTNVQMVKAGAFSGCTSLKGFVVDGNNNYLSEENGSLMSDSGRRLLCIANAAGDTIKIPGTVTEVSAMAISGNTKSLVIDTRNSKITFETGANATDSDIALMISTDGNVVEISESKLMSFNSGMNVDVVSVDYFGEEDMALATAVVVIAIITLVIQLMLSAIVRRVHNSNVWLFMIPTVWGCLTMFVYMLYETVTLSTDLFFTVTMFAWLALAIVELCNTYFAFISTNKSKGTSTIHRKGRVLTYSGAVFGTLIAMVTAILAYFGKIHVYSDAVPLLVITSVSIAATCILGIVVSRKIFIDIKSEQKKGLQL